MVVKLTPHNGQLALVLDPDLLQRLGIDAETPLNVTVEPGDRLVVSPARDPEHKKRLRESIEWTNRRYGRALKRLAE